ncbi:mitochondrial protein Pet127-domain-containing protein [Mycena leptocephala]|nr:mitochondrial protein Pet127-domain-containing protein [Mycena leptocephala]
MERKVRLGMLSLVGNLRSGRTIGVQIVSSRSSPLTPKDSKRQKPPHIGVPPAKESTPPKKKPPPPHKQAPVAYTRKIEGLIDPSEKPVLQPTTEHKPIATLEHGLERVLFNPGVHWLQDPRSRVYNFPPHLENIPKVTDFAFERLPGFIKSSRDEDLRALAKRQNRLFAGSTSSLTGMLSHCYFLISEHKKVDISSLSQNFQHEDKNFTPGQRMPTSVIFNYKEGVYAIDSDSEDTSKNILTWLGTLLEKFLTMSKAEFGTYLRRLPGTGVFDIKTRACLPVRMDILNWEENSGYLIKSAHGLVESFEREYYDLIRSAFLKYGFQVRIGDMDGVIVAYHNTARMFGFQYVSLEEMDQRLFGTEPGVGDRVFQKCVGLLESIAPEIVQCFPNQSVKVSKELNVWVQPADYSLTGEETEPPMRQLSIRTQSFLEESPVNGARAVNSSMPWTLHWSLSHLSADQTEIRKNFAKCMDRKFRAYSLPKGVSFEDLPQYWSELNFGSAPKAAEETDDLPRLPADFDYNKFRLPDHRHMTSQIEIEKYTTEEDRDIHDDVQSAVSLSDGQPQTSDSSVLGLDDTSATVMDQTTSTADSIRSEEDIDSSEDLPDVVDETIELEALHSESLSDAGGEAEPDPHSSIQSRE